MPTSEEKKRGVKYYRTKKVGKDKYVHIAVTKKAGPQGGHTIAGPVRNVKHHCPAEPL